MYSLLINISLLENNGRVWAGAADQQKVGEGKRREEERDTKNCFNWQEWNDLYKIFVKKF